MNDEFAAAGDVGVGATIMGRHMFGPVRGPWPDDSWRGWWGEDPPYHHPVFVLTHHAATIQAYLRAGQLDELHVAVVPVLLGGGERLFDHLDGVPAGYPANYTCTEFAGSGGVTHVRLLRTP